MSIFKDYEAEVLRLLASGVLSPRQLEVLVPEGQLVGYEHTGSGYFLSVSHASLPTERIVCHEPYLREWTDIAHTFDIATGYFEIGSLLALDGEWQKLDKLRILMGDEVTKRTKKALAAGIQAVAQTLDVSIEREKEGNDFLHGVPAIVEALGRKQIECRVYAKQKFHAKAYITHPRQRMAGSQALVGSSNFTLPGLTQNVEMNIRLELHHQVSLLQEWYERHWEQAEDITPEILKVIERHTREYTPFEVYAKALQQYFRARGCA